MAKGKSAADAYESAGYKPHRQNAARMMTNDDIAARVAELQGKVAKKVEVTVESLAAELEEARGLAKTEKQTSAMVSATLGKAKLFGLIIDKKQHSGTVTVVTLSAKDLDGLTDDELARLEAAYPVLEKLGLVGGGSGSEAAETG